MRKIKRWLQKLLLFLLKRFGMAYTTQQLNNLTGLILNSVCRNLSVGLFARTVCYDPDDTRNNPTTIFFEVTLSNGGEMGLTVEFNIANNTVDIHYNGGTITNIHELAIILQNMSQNLRVYESTIIQQFQVLIPPAV